MSIVKQVFALVLMIIIIFMTTILASLYYNFLSQCGLNTVRPQNHYLVNINPKYSIEEVDAKLAEKFEKNYSGYYGSKNSAMAKVNNKKEVNVWHLSDEVTSYQISVFNQIELFERKDNYDLLPIIVAGADNAYLVNQKLTLTLFSETDGSAFDVDCVIVGKSIMAALPRSSDFDYKQFVSNYKCTFIIPDVYRDKVFGKDDIYNFKISDDGNSRATIVDELSKYGTIVRDFSYNNYMGDGRVFVVFLVGYVFALILLTCFTFSCFNYSFKKMLNWRYMLNLAIISVGSLVAILLFKLTPLDDYFIINLVPLPIIIGIVVLIHIIMYFIGYKKSKKLGHMEIRSTYEKI